jgi:hypothetical protein
MYRLRHRCLWLVLFAVCWTTAAQATGYGAYPIGSDFTFRALIIKHFALGVLLTLCASSAYAEAGYFNTGNDLYRFCTAEKGDLIEVCAPG